jgi:hypothetical protein
MSESFASSIKRVFSEPAFLTVAGILLVAAISLNATTEFMQLHFKKERVELRKKLTELPARMGNWVQVSPDTAIDPETEEVLGTKDYIFRFYVDTTSPAVPSDVADMLRDPDPTRQRNLITQIQAQDPHALIYAAVTYYTGMVDTVAHIPNRCYVADGYEPAQESLVSWDAMRGRPGNGLLNYINFEDQTPQRRAVTKNVAYFFHSNGEYVSDPIGVRKKLQNLWESHGYYAKVELLMVTPDREQAAGQMNDFLISALPEIEKCLPDWDEVKAAPAKPDAEQTASAR